MAICSSISKYGIENFTFYILETHSKITVSDIFNRENYLYKLINPSYNLQSILEPFTGSNHYRFGSTVPQHVKNKISKTLTGRVRSSAHIDNHISGAHKKSVFCYDYNCLRHKGQIILLWNLEGSVLRLEL